MRQLRVFSISLLLGLACVCSCTKAVHIGDRQLLSNPDRDDDHCKKKKVIIDPSLVFENSRLRRSYIALQSWKKSILSDPHGFTSNWVGSDVCNYTGIYCAHALDKPKIRTVAGVDLNHGDIAGKLPEELGLLEDIAVFHINSNRFHGKVPKKLKHMKLLFELDLSNNRFVGKFPKEVLNITTLKFLDLRFNDFEGKLPRELFNMDLDAIFLNDNRFHTDLPDNFGSSPASVVVLANNNFHGCLPSGLSNMSNLNEIILLNNGFHSCLPPDIGRLKNATVLDVSFNKLMGPLPESIGSMVSLEQLNVAHNMLSGQVPRNICALPNLKNFTYSDNYFTNESPACLQLPAHDDRRNCLQDRPDQRSEKQCRLFLTKKPVDCSTFQCLPLNPPSPPPAKNWPPLPPN